MHRLGMSVCVLITLLSLITSIVSPIVLIRYCIQLTYIFFFAAGQSVVPESPHQTQAPEARRGADHSPVGPQVRVVRRVQEPPGPQVAGPPPLVPTLGRRVHGRDRKCTGITRDGATGYVMTAIY